MQQINKYTEGSKSISFQEGSIMKQVANIEANDIVGTYHVECYDANGNLKWSDSAKNVITTLGKNEILDKSFAGSAYTATMYMGLISGTSYTSVPVVGDTQASHATWNECGATTYGPDYTANAGQTTQRATVAWNAASAGSKATTATQFTIASTANGVTVKGCHISTIITKQGTTGILMSAGLFSGGDKTVATTDVLNVTYTAQLT